MLMRLFESCKHRAWKFFKQQFSMLIFIFAGVYHLQRRFNDVDHIVEDVVMLNDSINCLFVVCKLSIWILLKLFTRWMMFYKVIDVLQRYILVEIVCIVNDVVYKMFNVVCVVYKVKRLFAMWFINCKEVVWMFVNNGMNLLRVWLALLNGCQQVVWML